MASPWATWQVGPAPAGLRVVHRGQVVEDQARRVHHLDGASRGQHALGIAAQDVGHEQGEDGPEPLAGGEEAAAQRGLHPGRVPRHHQGLEGRLHLLATLLKRRFERGPIGGGDAHLGDGALRELVQRLQDLLGVAVHPHPREDLAHDTLRVDHEGGPDHADRLLAVEDLLAPGPVLLRHALSASESRGKFSLYLPLNFSWLAIESGLTPRTMAPFFLIAAWESRNAQASRVHPGVSSFG